MLMFMRSDAREIERKGKKKKKGRRKRIKYHYKICRWDTGRKSSLDDRLGKVTSSKDIEL